MIINTREEGKYIVITIIDGIYQNHMDQLKSSMRELLEKIGPDNKVIIDITRITYFSSMSLGDFALFANQVREKGGRLCAVNASLKVTRFLTRTRLDNIIPVYNSLENAKAFLSQF